MVNRAVRPFRWNESDDMRTIIALKPCPQGQQPGERFVVPDAHAAALVLVGAAAYADTDEDTRPRGRYRRRDLQAEEPHAVPRV